MKLVYTGIADDVGPEQVKVITVDDPEGTFLLTIPRDAFRVQPRPGDIVEVRERETEPGYHFTVRDRRGNLRVA